MKRDYPIAYVSQGMVMKCLTFMTSAQFAIELQEQFRSFRHPIAIKLTIQFFEHVEHVVLAAIAIRFQTYLLCFNGHADIAICVLVEIDFNFRGVTQGLRRINNNFHLRL